MLTVTLLCHAHSSARSERCLLGAEWVEWLDLMLALRRWATLVNGVGW
jgi:hypothetical protein